ncbi:MAG: hypothetical protein WCG78_01665 [Candidatus Omnitrophota bacterium]
MGKKRPAITKTIPCVKCKQISPAKETCPACGGSGWLTLKQITKPPVRRPLTEPPETPWSILHN